jgi:hypothetical protein
MRVSIQYAARLPGLAATATLLCGVVLIAETCGPVVKVSLWETTLKRAHSLVKKPSQHGDKPCGRVPGADPVLTLCTNSDWDRVARARPAIELKRLLFPAVIGFISEKPRGPKPAARRSAGEWVSPRPPQPATVNPNSRIHAPPRPDLTASA